jgi:DNA polymerase-1
MNKVDQQHRIHTSFNQTVTATGRLSSSSPNLQNIPVGSLEGINIRSAFIAKPRTRLMAADYSQIELRVMAHFSRDPNLQKAFVHDLDIHQHTASLVFSPNSSIPPGEQRRRAKIINFSIIYGSGAYSLAKELGISFSEARDFIDNYFTQYAGVKKFIESVVKEAKLNPVVKTIFQRMRHIPEIQSSNRNVAENGKRMAVNTIIQGSAADIIKRAMINIFKRLTEMESRMILQVHDELVFEYPLSEEKELERMVRQEMEGAVKLRIPLKIDLKKGDSWGSLL